MKLKIISDGTNAGTHLIDEDTGELIGKIAKLSWEVDVKNPLTKVIVEFLNIPVEIVSKADVELLEYNHSCHDFVPTKSFEKEIKIRSEGTMVKTIVYDTETQEPVGAIQNVKWEATPEKCGAKVKRIYFDKKDW